MGGELLLSLNVESIGYFGGVMDPDHARCQGLSQAADAEGKQVSHFSTWLDMHDPVDYVQTRDIKLVGPWLEHLDFPAGVLCLNDETARRLVHACELLGVHVPEQVAVLGIDNSHLCEFSRPQISSVDVNADRLGFEAARMATELIETGRCDPHQVLIEPRAVIHRESTGVLHSPDPVVSRAARYTIQHMEQDITAVDIAEAVGVGRSTLDRLFRRQGLPAPAGMLRKLRLDRAKQMLETTDLPLADVAARCGFNYLSHFSRAFKAEFGQSPSVYRDGA
jgi:LacI family transcriptional regulator